VAYQAVKRSVAATYAIFVILKHSLPPLLLAALWHVTSRNDSRRWRQNDSAYVAKRQAYQHSVVARKWRSSENSRLCSRIIMLCLILAFSRMRRAYRVISSNDYASSRYSSMNNLLLALRKQQRQQCAAGGK